MKQLSQSSLNRELKPGASLFLLSYVRFMYRVKVGENLFSEASAPSKKAARQLAAEEAVKELMAEGRLQLNKVRSGGTPPFLLRRQKRAQNTHCDVRNTANH